MAVLEISKIQLRRGKFISETGVPQLSAGEPWWALDTQQLFIGNGSVADGAPHVGNTRILTEHDLNSFTSPNASTLTLTDTLTPTLIISLPLPKRWSGGYLSDITYQVPYQYSSSAFDFARHGTLRIDANSILEEIKLTDTNVFLNDAELAHASDLSFNAIFLTVSGEEYTDPLTQTIGGIGVTYTNAYTGDTNGSLTFYAGSNTQYNESIPTSHTTLSLKNYGTTALITMLPVTAVDTVITFDKPFSTTPLIKQVSILGASNEFAIVTSIKDISATGMTLVCANNSPSTTETCSLAWYAEGN